MQPVEIQLVLKDEAATQQFAQCCAEQIQSIFCSDSPSIFWHLQGDLGAGKSFFSRALLQAFVPGMKVKSPTYTLVESYKVPIQSGSLTVHHFDLYRLCDPEELEYLAIRDLLQGPFLALIEWPQKAEPLLPLPDLILHLEAKESARHALLQGISETGQRLIELMKPHLPADFLPR
ncbi:MAG: tRNA (adenosine(37)-N6)-threonylcarbamoyltransferase complex ATPase subunit type 1 TsaE [Thiotrichales bacterium]|nr:tRNA (adenosine(37)-N6)-threonylcarbamoyltransferase complex ATPase subunit type 1 TsaE [Thiotrichales bacterium]